MKKEYVGSVKINQMDVMDKIELTILPNHTINKIR